MLSQTGEFPGPGRVTIPILSELIRLENCHDVAIRNLSVGEADDDRPAAGEVDGQAAAIRRGAVRLIGARRVTITDCQFRGLGGYAIDLGRGSNKCRITRCELTNLGAGGVRIGGMRPKDAPAAVVSGHEIEGGTIYSLPPQPDRGKTYSTTLAMIC